MPIAPYLRPDLDQTADQLPLYITGTLPNAKPGEAYEGRLQIHNQIGACSIVSVTGSDVPPGGSWYVDGDELVLQWPEYAENYAPISNPGFESGMDGWTAGAGWSVTTNNPIDGTTSGVFKNASGESVLSSNSRYPVNGESFSAHCKVRQGASSAGNAGGAVRVEFRDADGMVVGFKDGNRVMSASNNAVKPSNVAISPSDYPAGAMTVNIAGLGIRKRQNREVWADTFSWDYRVAASGVNIETQLCFTVTVRDSAGRPAQWSGCVTVVSHQWDGTWIATTVPAHRYVPNAIWIEEWGMWVATFYANSGTTTVRTSPDLVTWTSRFTLSDGHNASIDRMGLAWSPDTGTLLVAQSYLNYYIVTDPVTFAATPKTRPRDYVSYFWFEAVSAFVGTSGGRVYVSASADSGSWIEKPFRPTGGLTYATRFTYDEANEVFVVLGNGGKVWHSADLNSWTGYSTTTFPYGDIGVALYFSRVLNKLVFIQQQNVGAMYTSSDAGITWELAASFTPDLPTSFAESPLLNVCVVGLSGGSVAVIAPDGSKTMFYSTIHQNPYIISNREGAKFMAVRGSAGPYDITTIHYSNSD